MFQIKRRRTRIRLLSYSIAAFVVALGLAVSGWWVAYVYRRNIEYSYQQALSELSEHVNSIDMALQKAIYAGTPTQLVGLSAEIWRDSGAAKADLAQIPLLETRMDNTYKFISQVGDYVNSMSQDVAFDQKITNGDRTKMKQLSAYAKKLSQQLSDMVEDMQEGRLTIFTADKAIKSTTASETGSVPAVESDFSDIEEDFTSMPSLIYDGPFSDNVSKKTPVFTKNKAKVTQDKARKEAADFLRAGTGSLSYSGDTAGNLPTYNFTSGSVSISVTKAGGIVLSMLDSRTVNAAKISTEAALKKARQFLKDNGIASMTESYYQTSNNICVINYAYVQGNVVCYPDLIKVGIAMDTGSVVSFDATGYVMNHKQRDLPKAKVTEKAARQKISPLLTVEKVSLAVIPTENQEECFCYEFKCKSDSGRTVLDYYNVSTGREEQVLILLKTAGGTLAI